MKIEFSREFFEKYSNVKFHANPSRGRLVVSSGQDMTQLLVAVRNFTKAPKTDNK